MPVIQTLSGRILDYSSPSPESISIHDIAWALSRIPRFCGHTDEFYSVAQHSYYVSWLIRLAGGDKNEQLIGLLHDATEAYISDIPSPLKGMLSEIREIEHGIWCAISEKYAGGAAISKLTKRCDRQMLAIEANQLRVSEYQGALLFPEIDNSLPPVTVCPLTELQARELFLETFFDLYPADDVHFVSALEPLSCR